MNILFVNSIQNFGGSAAWMVQTLRALRARGHGTLLSCGSGTELAFRARKAGLPIWEYEFRSRFDLIALLRLSHLMRKYQIDVVLTNMDVEMYLAGIAARLVRPRPVVFTRRGIDYPLKNKLGFRFAGKSLIARIIANSEATRASLLHHAPWLLPEQIEVIHNGIEPAAYEQADGLVFRRKWKIRDQDLLLGFVGRLDEHKGIGVLLSAFEHIHSGVPEVRLVFVGDGPLREMIESEIRSKGWQKQVLMTGFMEDMTGVMQAIDLLVLPSYWEGFGTVIIEAMAASKPVISTNISSMPEIISDGETGFLVPPGDSEALAASVIEVLQNTRLRQSLGERGHKRILERFSQSIMINHLESLFKNVLAKRKQQEASL